jgi:hypothetical protein
MECNCYYYNVEVVEDDLLDSDDGNFYVIYYDCSTGAQLTLVYSVAGTYTDALCNNSDVALVSYYIIKDGNQTVPSYGSQAVLTFTSCCPTQTPTPTQTQTPTQTPTQTSTQTPTQTSTQTPTNTRTPNPTPSTTPIVCGIGVTTGNYYYTDCCGNFVQGNQVGIQVSFDYTKSSNVSILILSLLLNIITIIL